MKFMSSIIKIFQMKVDKKIRELPSCDTDYLWEDVKILSISF